MSKTQTQSGLLVRFENVGRGRKSWEERIERPVSDEKIVAAVRRKRVLASNGVDAESTSDYGGAIFAGDHLVGTYFIVPFSDVENPAKAADAAFAEATEAAIKKA